MPPVQECAHLYPDGRHCRRLPKRGHRLCHGHQHPRRLPGREDAAFHQQMFAWVDRLHALPLDDLLHILAGCLSDLTPILERKASRRHRLVFTRATIAITQTQELVDAARIARRAQSAARSLPPGSPAAPPRIISDEIAAQLRSAQTLTSEELMALCDRLESTLPSNHKPHPLHHEMDRRHPCAPANATIGKQSAFPQPTLL